MKTLLLLCFLASTQAILWPEKRIVNGGPAKPFSSPYQVSLQYLYGTNNWVHTCGGVLMATNTVLTAAQCVHQRDESMMRVVAGAQDLVVDNGYRQISFVRSIFIHENYNGTFPGHASDIALIQLRSPMTLTDNVQAAELTLLLDETFSYDKTKCVITGWGLTSTSPPSAPQHLQTANVTEISTAECQSMWLGQMVTDEHVCVYGDFAPAGQRPSACMGDGGGPMMCGDNLEFLIGIASWSSNTCHGEKPSVYTRVPAYLSWFFG